jgi:hypothetical protein
MTDRNLSPQAQAVLDAYWKSPWDPGVQHEDRYAIAAALRAAADQVMPIEGELPLNMPDRNTERRKFNHLSMQAQRQTTRNQLLAIATELETDD